MTCLPFNELSQSSPEQNSSSLDVRSTAVSTTHLTTAEPADVDSLLGPPPPVVPTKSSAIPTGVIRLAWNYGPVSLELMPSRIRVGLPFLLLQRKGGVVSVLAPTPSVKQWHGFLGKYVADETARRHIDSNMKGRPLIRVLETSFEGSELLHHQVRDWLSKVRLPYYQPCLSIALVLSFLKRFRCLHASP